jgi:hypothetical protein
VTESWTSEQIIALAPDTSSAKAGRELATPRKWVTLGRSEQAVWGECQGSGAKPYQTKIDLTEPAFNCSCPSRKFPCKHGLGLFLLLAAQPALFPAGEPPDWVSEWLTGRMRRAEQREKRLETSDAPPDPAAQAKRTADRERKVRAGLEELDRWLGDAVRRGLAALHGEPGSFWEGVAARLVDAQAPGLARQVRQMAGVAHSGLGWQERLLTHLGRLHLAVEGYRRMETLLPEAQADLRTLIGWTQSQEEVLAGPAVRDEWLVLGRLVEEEDRLRVQRTWLRGRHSARAALVLHFAPLAAGAAAMDTSLVPGTAVDAELAFFTSAWPLRALVKARHGTPASVHRFEGHADIDEALCAYAGALARCPWLEQFPMPLVSVVPARPGDIWQVRDAAGRVLPLSPRFAGPWPLLALSGGYPVTLFGEWDGCYFLPLSVSTGDRFLTL